MTFKMRTTHLPSDPSPGAPPWLLRLPPHGNYRVGRGHGIPSFGRARGKVRVGDNLARRPLFSSRECSEHGEGGRRKKLTAINDWHYGCLFSVRAFFPLSSSFFLFSSLPLSSFITFTTSLATDLFFFSPCFLLRNHTVSRADCRITYSNFWFAPSFVSGGRSCATCFSRGFFQSLCCLTRDDQWATM